LNTSFVRDPVEAALNVPARIGQHLAMLARQKLGELVHILLDQFPIFEHDACAALRIGRGPCRLGCLGGVDRLLESRGGAERQARLHFSMRRVPHVALAVAFGQGGAVDEMLDATHGWVLGWIFGLAPP
jgi:hypothetical protein